MFRLEPGSASPFANIPRVDDAHEAPLFFCSDKSPNSVASPEDANVILNEFYDIQTSKEDLEAFIEKYKDVPEAEPILNTAKQALNNNNSKPVTKKEIEIVLGFQLLIKSGNDVKRNFKII